MILFIVPKNSGLKRCKEYVSSIVDDSSKIKTVRGEDVPFFVESLLNKGKQAIGLTGKDLFEEFTTINSDSDISVLETVPWQDPSALFGKPTLCLLGPKGRSLSELPIKLKVGVNKKYEQTARTFLRTFKKKECELFLLSGTTELSFESGLADLVIDIVYSGTSAREAGLEVYEKISESDMVIIGRNLSWEGRKILNQLDFKKMQGLIPTIVQDESRKVLMLAYSSYESLQKTMESGKGWYYSRSRKELWCKGETSGNTQKVQDISLDCDADTLLFKVLQTGCACHTGKYSCFGLTNKEFLLQDLYEKVCKRMKEEHETYTTRLIKNPALLTRKLLEEAAEVITAKTKQELVWESSDLLYFLVVLLAREGVTLQEIDKENARRNLGKD